MVNAKPYSSLTAAGKVNGRRPAAISQGQTASALPDKWRQQLALARMHYEDLQWCRLTLYLETIAMKLGAERQPWWLSSAYECQRKRWSLTNIMRALLRDLDYREVSMEAHTEALQAYKQNFSPCRVFRDSGSVKDWHVNRCEEAALKVSTLNAHKFLPQWTPKLYRTTIVQLVRRFDTFIWSQWRSTHGKMLLDASRMILENQKTEVCAESLAPCLEEDILCEMYLLGSILTRGCGSFARTGRGLVNIAETGILWRRQYVYFDQAESARRHFLAHASSSVQHVVQHVNRATGGAQSSYRAYLGLVKEIEDLIDRMTKSKVQLQGQDARRSLGVCIADLKSWDRKMEKCVGEWKQARRTWESTVSGRRA